jgi:tRNA-specific 2-thiouridylase
MIWSFNGKDFEVEYMKVKPASVVVALSGGVDSSMAASLLKTAGWDVHGLHLLITTYPSISKARINSCQRIAEYLQIPLNIIDLTDVFSRQIIDPFVHAYLKGFTPNPCIMCNEVIKFAYLLRYAEEHGIRYLATGHYVRVKTGDGCIPVELWRGKDRGKEQSYFLHRLSQDCLSKALFPLGELTKKEVKDLADKMDLPVHLRPESQEICFIPDNDYRLFVEKHRGVEVKKTGNIVDGEGKVLGEHAGAYRYTIGQRHGLGIASSRPYYVKEIRPDTNEVVVGRKEELYSSTVEAEGFNWIFDEPSQKLIKAQAQVRYRHRAAPGRLETISPDRVRFIFDEPQWAVTPGQALVCYKGERVIGGGWITKGLEA